MVVDENAIALAYRHGLNGCGRRDGGDNHIDHTVAAQVGREREGASSTNWLEAHFDAFSNAKCCVNESREYGWAYRHHHAVIGEIAAKWCGWRVELAGGSYQVHPDERIEESSS